MIVREGGACFQEGGQEEDYGCVVIAHIGRIQGAVLLKACIPSGSPWE